MQLKLFINNILRFKTVLTRRKGQTLLEVLVAMSVGILVLTAITSSVLSSLVNVQVSKTQNLANQYAQEGMEIARFSRTAASGKYCLDKGKTRLSGIPQGTCTTPNVDGRFIRTVDVFGSTGGANCGSDVNKMVVTVQWADGKCTGGAYCHKVQLDSCTNVLALAGTITPTPPPPGAPTAVLDPPSPYSTITVGNSTTLSWNSTNAISCTWTSGLTGAVSASGIQSVTPSSTTTYTLYCTSSLGVNSSPVSRVVTVNPPPTLSGFSATFNPISSGNSAKLIWSSTNAVGCTAGNGWSGAKPASQVAPGASTQTITTATTFSLFCTSSDNVNTSTSQVTVNVNPAPTTTLNANPLYISSGESSTLTWSSTNAVGCTASGGWSGAKATSGTQVVSPTSTTTYNLYCTASDGFNSTPTQSKTVTFLTKQLAYGTVPTTVWSTGTYKRTLIKAKNNITVRKFGCYNCGNGSYKVYSSDSIGTLGGTLRSASGDFIQNASWWDAEFNSNLTLTANNYYVFEFNSQSGFSNRYNTTQQLYTDIDFLKRATDVDGWATGAFEIRIYYF